MKELLEAKIPLVGISALPMENNLYEWHGNLRGPSGSPWAGGVFHISISFPIEYPVLPPSITLFSTIPHPNVFGPKLCLDMLENTGEGKWMPAYTVEAILI
jgi:ubiquitin-protein ligase